MKYLPFAFLVILAVIALISVIEAATATGPNCPGKDPAWLGFCDAATEAV